MADEELCETFGTTLEEVEADVKPYESGNLEGMEFGELVYGEPQKWIVLEIDGVVARVFCATLQKSDALEIAEWRRDQGHRAWVDGVEKQPPVSQNSERTTK